MTSGNHSFIWCSIQGLARSQQARITGIEDLQPAVCPPQVARDNGYPELSASATDQPLAQGAERHPSLLSATYHLFQVSPMTDRISHPYPTTLSAHRQVSVAHKLVNPAPPPDARRFLVHNPTRILSSKSSRDWSLDPAVGRVGGRAAHLDTSNQG